MDTLDTFKTQTFEPIYLEKMGHVLSYYLQHKQMHIDQWIELLEAIKEKIPCNEQRCHIHFGLSWTSLFVEKKPVIEVLYLSSDMEAVSVASYDAHWLFQSIYELEEGLEKERKPYVGKITRIHVRQLLHRGVYDLFFYFVLLCREAMGERKLEALLPANLESVTAGDWTAPGDPAGNTYMVYHRFKDRGWFDKKGNIPSCGGFTALDMGKAVIEGRDLSFAAFETCKFVKSQISAGDCVSAVFNNCLMEECLFTKVSLCGASFSNSNLRKAAFTSVTAYHPFYSAVLKPASFTGSDLSHAVFKNCDLENVDFTGAVLAHTDFTGSRLRGAKFREETRAALSLDSSQGQGIQWI